MRRNGAATAALLTIMTAGCADSTPPTAGPPPASPSAAPTLAATTRPTPNGRPAPTPAAPTPDPNLFETPHPVGSVAISAGGVWVMPHLTPAAVRIDPSTRKTTEIPLPGIGAEVSASGTELWASISEWGTFKPIGLVRIDTVRRKLTVTVPVPAVSPFIIDDSVWAVGEDGTLYVLDRTDGKRLRTIATGVSGAAISVAGGYLWLSGTARTLRVDPRTYAVSDVTARLGTDAPQVAGAGRLWALTRDGGLVTYAPDLTGRRVIDLSPMRAFGTIWFQGAPWVGVAAPGEDAPNSMVRVDPISRAVTATLKAPHPIEAGWAIDAKCLWLPMLRQLEVYRMCPPRA